MLQETDTQLISCTIEKYQEQRHLACAQTLDQLYTPQWKYLHYLWRTSLSNLWQNNWMIHCKLASICTPDSYWITEASLSAISLLLINSRQAVDRSSAIVLAYCNKWFRVNYLSSTTHVMYFIHVCMILKAKENHKWGQQVWCGTDGTHWMIVSCMQYGLTSQAKIRMQECDSHSFW